ncbi:NAD-binding protein, partial [Pseudomonas aeruginosa]
MTKTSKNRHHVVIIGAGFGGIEVANQLAGVEVDVTIIDRRNHHLFQPL